MSRLQETLPQYLELRGGLGHKLAESARLLPRFVTWMEDNGHDRITIELAMQWCQLPAVSPGSTVWSRRMTAVRGFARYMSGVDPETQIPPPGLLPCPKRWTTPYVFTPAEIKTLIDGAARLPDTRMARTYTTLFGLLAATGMRIGEAIRMDISDINWEQGVLTIRESKFGKSRLIPLHLSITDKLAGYAGHRDDYRPEVRQNSFFISTTGRRLIYGCARSVFVRICTHSGIGAGFHRQVKLHDLRHSLAVTTLLDWYRDGHDVTARLPMLSTYLGHREPASTYWYLSASPQLLRVAADRLDPMIQAVTPS